MQREGRATYLMVDFFTRCYRISGSVDVSSRKLADQLEDRTTSFLDLRDGYVSRVEHPADIVANHASSVLRKESILAAVVAREEDGLSRSYSYGSYLGAHLQRAFLVVSAFEIQGHLRLAAKRDLRSVLTSGDLFVPVLDGQMRYSMRRDIEFSGGVILVNRASVEVIWAEG
jgi:hypothetical protein